jgi:hypothetical protein
MKDSGDDRVSYLAAIYKERSESHKVGGGFEENGLIGRSLNGLVACKVDAFDQDDRKVKFRGM